jgi:hypothetical protein
MTKPQFESAGTVAGTDTVAVEELLAMFGSVVAAETRAVLAIGPAEAGPVTTSATVAEPPFGTEPMEHTTALVPEQEPWDGVAETKATPAGSTSVTVTPVAVLGPAFATAMLYVMFEPSPELAGPLLIIETSAWLAAVVLMVQLLVAPTAAESRTLAAKEVLPMVVGAPVTAPVAAFRSRPGGSAPVVENV